jgi:predicted peroxiredoxin
MIICGSAEKFEELVCVAKEHGCEFLISDESIEMVREALKKGTIKEIEVVLTHTYFDLRLR